MCLEAPVAAFETVDPKVRFPELEEQILAWWDEADVFRRSLELREGAPTWIFYEGPPTANGKPGIHHVEPRTFKDVYPRFKTMTGHLVPRKGGWDCHGLPVEIEVEKQIGTTGKKDIEAFGVAEFNRLCRESVLRYVGEFERLTRRIGFWIDMSDAYRTMDTDYIESVWWSLKELHRRGLLVEDHKVTAYCPRCGTALSDAEVALGYAQTVDPSVFVRLPVVESPDPSLVGASLVIWTTTPWTLPSNTGVAVDAQADYDEVELDGERLVLAASLRQAVLGEDGVVRATRRGAALVGARYEPPYPNVEGAHTVVAGDFVTLEDGTGIVHLAPAFGEADLEVGRANGWPVWRPVGDDGRFTDLAPTFVRGAFVKDADPLDRRGPARARHPRQGGGLRARVPLLLAVLDAAPVLRAARLVRPHHGREGPVARGERIRAMGPRAHPRRPVRQLAREQRRLGAVAGALLGHAAADLALRERPRDRGRLARRSSASSPAGTSPASTRIDRRSTR